jgi:hypothetical protein
MAENESLTPEKQLLKLIQNPSTTTLQTHKVKREGKKWFSLGALRGRLGFLKSISAARWSSLGQRVRTPPGLRQVNMALKFCILFLVLYLSYGVVAMAIQLRKASQLILQPDKSIPFEMGEPVTLKNLSYYTDKVGARDIFKLGPTAKAPDTPESTVVPPEEDLSKNFSLVGIAWSNDPEAMIENTQLKRTHFVKRGQFFDQSIKVVAIFKDRVVLGQNEKEFELK